MTTSDPDVVVFRKGTEGLSTEAYASAIRDRLPDHEVRLARTPHEERELIQEARVATGTSISDELVDAAEDLELFVAASSGYNHLPMDELTDRGVAVANAAGIHAPGIAEQALGYCLMFARRLHEGWARKQDAQWRHYKADEFTGSTVTVVGLGAIGQAIVQRLEGTGVDTIGVRYTPEKGGPTDEVIGFDDRAFHEALAETDYLVLSTPLSDTTESLVGESELATLSPESVIINVCRGPVVDTEALLKSIQNEDIRGAAMDVTDPEPLPADHPLWKMDNVLITPHMGGHTPKHWERLADILAENVRALDADGVDVLRNQVNDPGAKETAAESWQASGDG
jgi:phosphoglycerate dehydrogenase-like enzyme